jgi:arabinogalactan oligomer / maltooligosaccharide transport system permease protein
LSVVEKTTEVVLPRTKERRQWRPKGLGDTWWRHLVGIAFSLIALFPVAYVLSAAFNADSSLSSASLIPRQVTLANFGKLLKPANSTIQNVSTGAEYGHWYLNSLIIASATAILTVLFGALAAYAFSRFRFKGRRLGMLGLLLVQMFPQLLLIVAIYLIVLHVGKIFPVIGLNSLAGLTVVYLGGILGVNTWLMKGFFDTIPAELDESARVDGATPAQVFWGIVLPLAAPVLAVLAFLSFVGVMGEFVIASVILQTTNQFTLPLGLRFFIDQQYSEHWGPFAAGVVLAAIPIVILFMSLQRFFVRGLTGGAVKG